MTDDQFTAHQRALLAWMINNAWGLSLPPPGQWRGSETLHVDFTTSDGAMAKARFETHNQSRRVIAKLRLFFKGEGSVVFETPIPRDVVEASMAGGATE